MSVDPHRGGYSLIELLIVISVMILLSSMALTRVVGSMRSSAVSQAMSNIRDVASQAQARAMALSMGLGQAYPGVLIGRVEGRWQVALVESTSAGAGSVSWAQALADEQGRTTIHQLSPNVMLWLGETVAGDAARLIWYYEPGTGRVVVPEASGFSRPGAMIGYEPPPLFDAGNAPLVFGAKPGVTALTCVHPPIGATPGVSFRSRDQRNRYALAILPSGILNLEEW